MYFDFSNSQYIYVTENSSKFQLLKYKYYIVFVFQLGKLINQFHPILEGLNTNEKKNQMLGHHNFLVEKHYTTNNKSLDPYPIYWLSNRWIETDLHVID